MLNRICNVKGIVAHSIQQSSYLPLTLLLNFWPKITEKQI